MEMQEKKKRGRFMETRGAAGEEEGISICFSRETYKLHFASAPFLRFVPPGA